MGGQRWATAGDEAATTGDEVVGAAEDLEVVGAAEDLQKTFQIPFRFQLGVGFLYFFFVFFFSTFRFTGFHDVGLDCK